MPALDVSVSVAEAAPKKLGAKFTLIEQDAPGFTGLEQVFRVAVKSELFVPVTVAEVMVSAAVPALGIIRGSVLLVPRLWFPNASEGGTAGSAAGDCN